MNFQRDNPAAQFFIQWMLSLSRLPYEYGKFNLRRQDVYLFIQKERTVLYRYSLYHLLEGQRFWT